MDHITTTIAKATPDQQARARALAPTFAAASGLQTWSTSSPTALALYNIMQNDASPQKRVAPATAKGTTPVFLLPVGSAGIHYRDMERLRDFLMAQPPEVEAITLHIPRLGVLKQSPIGYLKAVIC